MVPALLGLAAGLLIPLLVLGSAATLWITLGWAAVIALAVPAGVLTARPLAHQYRRLCVRRLRKTLARLTPEQRLLVLRPLQGDPEPDTRALVQPLLREFGLSTELTPSSAPTGRGDELTAGE